MEAILAVLIGVIVVKVAASLLVWRAWRRLEHCRRAAGFLPPMRLPREIPCLTPEQSAAIAERLVEEVETELRAKAVFERVLQEGGIAGHEIDEAKRVYLAMQYSQIAQGSREAGASDLVHRLRIGVAAARALAANNQICLNRVLEECEAPALPGAPKGVKS